MADRRERDNSEEPTEVAGPHEARPAAGVKNRAAAVPPRTSPSRAGSRFEPGATIGHYEIIRPLGQGGMGEVYLARDTRLGRRVALKFLLQVDALHSGRFFVEARATAQLAHENIVALHDIAEHEGLPYMALEYVPGKTLSTWLRERRDDGLRPGIPPLRAAELMLPVARALQCAHEAGIVHRDLKPSNIMLAESGAVKVLDFGIAKLLGDASPSEAPTTAPEAWTSDPAAMAALTETGVMIGTRAYMAPEQWRGEPVDGRADIWALGVMLHQMTSGEHPLAPLTPESLVTVGLHDVPMPSVRERIPEIGKLGSVIDRCLLKHREDRLGSARELCEELDAILRPHASALRAEDEDASPYAGLAAFQERDATRFFGREALVEHIVSRLVEQPFLSLIGSSGAGKSSLVRAGVIPALKRGGDAWAAFVLRPGPRPLAALADLLLQHSWQRTTDGAPDSLPLSGDLASLSNRLRREPGFLGVLVRSRARRRRERILLFVDQFEEVYTLASEDEREAFLRCLSGAADDPSSPVRVIVSIRHDFLDRVASSASALSELVSRGTVLVGPLDRRGLQSALVTPAEVLSHRFESEALVTEMLDALSRTVGALPLLQFTAAKLWEGRDRARRLLTEASYRAFGGVEGALASHADSVVSGMSEAERTWARALLLRLVTPERTRALVTRRELSEIGSSAPEVERVLERLVDARLLVVETASGGESTVELVHESLIERWPLLGRWLEQEADDAHFRARLRNAAKEWEASGFAEGLLWRGDAAEEARRWRVRQGGQGEADKLSAREAQYLSAVVGLDERERRRKRQVVAVVIASLSLVVLVVSALAVRSSRETARAEQEAARARARQEETARSAARARNATRMAAARERQGDPTTVLALLREIEPKSAPRGWSELAGWARMGASRVVLTHDDAVRSAAFSPDGARIATTSEDLALRVWNADGSGKPLVLRGHDARVFAATFSPDGKRIASASWDKTVRVWNADGSGEPLVLRGHDHYVYAASFSPDGKRIASASWDRTVRVWNADGSGQPLVLRGHEATLQSVAFSPDGKRIASASWDKTVRVWNADGSGQPLVLRGHDSHVYSVAWSPDGRHIVSASVDKTLRVWNADGSGEPLVLRGHADQVWSAAFSPDGRHIASASVDTTVRVWNADGSGQSLVFGGHQSMVFAVGWSPDGERLVSASNDGTARVWNTAGSNHILVLRGHEGAVGSAHFSPDGQRIVSASEDRTVRVWNADGSGRPLVLRGHESDVNAATWSPDAKRIVSASADRTLRVWNADGSGQPLVLRGHEDQPSRASFSPDGARIVSASFDKTLRIWNADGTGEPLVLRGHDEVVHTAGWSPDGKRIVSASWDKTVRVWNADGTGEPLILRGHERRVRAAAWSPDGKRIVSASEDKTVRVWNADGTGEPLIFRGHEDWINSAAFSPDGKRIVTASFDKTVRLWDAEGSGQLLTLRSSSAPILAAGWSPDGKRVVAASYDRNVTVWSDLEPLRDADDPRLWTATSYCMPLEVRHRLLDFPEEQSRADLERCQRRSDVAGR
ncbi:WD40 repeat domain-containing serine/threonine protein kinase [Polyangium aurulentum]|uniref:WD40 repeat domain-containing serine/threonine protein kinase n=1 Tax=Polyangium aurulentum TaxID=2567896 RepID=UPI0010AEC9D9|nr:protein kinase [Polyangium aurulentum]UQA59483.1 protein kinase [Polyangium aurulentum]